MGAIIGGVVEAQVREFVDNYVGVVEGPIMGPEGESILGSEVIGALSVLLGI